MGEQDYGYSSTTSLAGGVMSMQQLNWGFKQRPAYSFDRQMGQAAERARAVQPNIMCPSSMVPQWPNGKPMDSEVTL